MSLSLAVEELKVKEATEATRRLNEMGVEPKIIMASCETALARIGERYAQGEYFIAGLIMAGEVFSRVLDLVTPRWATEKKGLRRARVMIGTVKGDIHGLGKNIAGALLSAYGFEVNDLGVDVPASEFVNQAAAFRPDAVGLSVLLTSCFASLRETVEALARARGEAELPFIFISGGLLSDELIDSFGADFYVQTAFDTVRLCERLIGHETQSYPGIRVSNRPRAMEKIFPL
ncbi:MAG: cobalamin-dependent protein [Deltaproteobacteria bacterium]|nr:cobalamin-dependent protein [Deltaproteobacteria bacterium]